MKNKLIISCIMFLAIGTTAIAQDIRNELVFGAKAGVNVSNVWDEQGQDFVSDSKAGFAGGIFLGIPIGTILGIQPELLISQKGFKGSGTLLGYPYSFSKTTTYIDIPLQIQLKPVSFLTIVAGPQYSFLMHSTSTFTYGVNSVEQEREFENDNIRKNVLGFVGGLDVNISHLVISGRMGWDFQSNHGDGTSSTPRYRNQWLQLTAGYKF